MVKLPRASGSLGAILPVGVGLVVQAITAYLTLILAGRILGAATFGGLAALYVLISTFSTGLFQPLEQEVARRLGRARETGAIDPSLLRRALRFGLSLCAVVVALLLVFHHAAVDLLGGQTQLLIALCVGLPGYALCYVARGGLSGTRRLRRYGVQLSVEGTFRLVGIGVLALFGVHTVTSYGWLFGLAPWVAVAFSIFGLRPLGQTLLGRAQVRPAGVGAAGVGAAGVGAAGAGAAGAGAAGAGVAGAGVAGAVVAGAVVAGTTADRTRAALVDGTMAGRDGASLATGAMADRTAGPLADAPADPLVAPLGLLLVSTLSAQLLIGAGPLTAQLFNGGQGSAAAGAFLAALVVVRVPVFLFTAVQPSMLPTMAAHVAAGRRAEFRSLLTRVLALMGLVAVVTTLATTMLGPWGLRILFGPDFVLSRGVFALMGVSVGLFLAAGVLGQAVLALGQHRLVTLGWLVGLAGLALGMILGHDLVSRATLGLLIGAGAAALTFVALLTAAPRHRPVVPDPVPVPAPAD